MIWSQGKNCPMRTQSKVHSFSFFRLLLIVAAVVFFAGAADGAGEKASSKKNRTSRPAGAASMDSGKYIGPGSCSSTSCHGSVKPRAETRVLQNEYSAWVVKDKHSKAYSALTSPGGERMSRILKLGAKAEQAPRCLGCHALYVPENQRGRTFDLNEGVSCESCHGPASGWLGSHTVRGWTHEQSIAAGMVDTRDLIQRTRKCLSCHLGNQEKFVDHEMIAAGHPDLYFELDSFSAVMPRHWNMPRMKTAGEPAEDGSWIGVREWAAGQAVQLGAGLERLAARARGKVWPEYSEMDCIACHHALTTPQQSWRQERGYPGRRPGDAPWNSSRYAVFRIVAERADAAMARELDSQLVRLAEIMSKGVPDRDAAIAAATNAIPLTAQLAQRLARLQFDPATTLHLLQRISADDQGITSQGERAAEQAAMALDSLFIAYNKSAKPASAAELRAAINGLFQQVENPSSYNPENFARQMHKVNSLLR